LTEGGTVSAQVDSNVEHGASRTAHELDLGMRGLLIMHAPQRTGHHAASGVYLGYSRIEARMYKFLRAPLPCEETTFITPLLEFDYEHSGNYSFSKNHFSSIL
jgi:hypothetical protein